MEGEVKVARLQADQLTITVSLDGEEAVKITTLYPIDIGEVMTQPFWVPSI